MRIDPTLSPTPEAWLAANAPDEPVFLFHPARLMEVAREFLTGFPGLVTYAVKANPAPEMIRALHAAGIRAFDVASPAEMALVRAEAPGAALHYHNPVRSAAEVAAGLEAGCVSWSVDRMAELEKLAGLPRGTEIAVRLKLPVAGAAYDFGTKFGATPEQAVQLLRRVEALGFTASITFHPGTQCTSPAPWGRYINEAAAVARSAGVTLHRLNVGGGFPAHRDADRPDLQAIFDTICEAAQGAFDNPPHLVCEPGRALAAEALTLATRVKGVHEEAVFLNDGVYGGLAEWRDIAPMDRVRAVSRSGGPLQGERTRRVVFGPTCDSIDRLPELLPLPCDLTEGDYLLFEGMGAYSRALVTGFNGYGVRRVVEIENQG
ncbi:type III PLP-dependent enzyme [Yangia mangrovi]|uniref:ornithine decarboxylase n=1 Tax=Alloyangia mangrovi TaxID=1779329 RepID=A0A2A3JUA3_9RHOB|nr:type III PLP-dependent enzyme [Alloyangia mangrovi]MCA0941193.1 type III PLP-dependent enzyme [Alloyangia pacifica]MCA0945471.1 type III PLP-dependent enzyme [Alloyangia pacifica]MCT4369794.1 type III PLP-dependent enzyme [Alloyangia mangrovi]